MEFLGLENFRIFNEPISLDFKPLTIITGPNSAGKSSVFKALQLLQNNLNESDLAFPLKLNTLSFNKLNHQLGSFKRMVSNSSKDSTFNFTIPFWLYFIKKTSGKLEKGVSLTKVHKEGGAFAEMYPYVLKDLRQTFPGNPWSLQLSYSAKESEANLEGFKIFNKQQILYDAKIEGEDPETGKILYNHTLDIKWFYKVFVDSFNIQVENKPIPINSLLLSYEGYKPEKDYDLNKLINTKELDALQELFKNRIISSSHGNIVEDFMPYELTKSLDINQALGLDSKANYRGYFRRDEKMLFSSVEETFDELKVNGFSETYFAFFKFLRIILNRGQQELIGKYLYLSSLRGTVQRVYSVDDGETPINEILRNFVESKSKEKDKEFIVKWLKEFDIGDDFVVETHEGAINIPYIVFEKRKVLLADLGFGVTQLLPLILLIASSKDVMIEEPESNLHPKLQSKLADMFAEIINKKEHQLLIETHSEYLIRRLQFLVANETISKDDVVIYYFRSPKAKNEPLVKKIIINKDGYLSDSFGSGFLDEADNLAIDLFNLKKFTKN